MRFGWPRTVGTLGREDRLDERWVECFPIISAQLRHRLAAHVSTVEPPLATTADSIAVPVETIIQDDTPGSSRYCRLVLTAHCECNDTDATHAAAPPNVAGSTHVVKDSFVVVPTGMNVFECFVDVLLRYVKSGIFGGPKEHHLPARY